MLTCLQAATDISHSIVRPTAFFKSVAGQVQLVKDGAPFVMFGDGTLAACKPISESNLASFMADCVVQKDKVCGVWGGGWGRGGVDVGGWVGVGGWACYVCCMYVASMPVAR